MSEIHNQNKLTLKEFELIDAVDGIVYEFIDGVVCMSKPSIEHQRISGRVFRKFGDYFDKTKFEPIQEIEIKLNEDILVPDISVLCDENKFTEQRYNGAPEISVEILSPSTTHMDLFTKLYKYEMYGVKEYWIISPKGKTITVHNFVNKSVNVYDMTESAKSELFEGLEICLSEIF